MIVSSTTGRLRARCQRLYDTRYAADRVDELLALNGVMDVRHNGRAGSILVRFDPSTADLAAIRSALGAPPADEDAPTRRATPLSRRLRRFALPTMLGATVGTILLGSKRLHAVAGVAFVGIALLHWHEKRSRHFDGATGLEREDSQ